MKKSSSPPQVRGTIVVDSSAMTHLCGEVSHTLRRDGGKLERYLDTLPFLAANGYRIVIPEILVVMGGHMLADGTDLDRYFPESESTQSPVKAVLKRFFKDAVLPAGSPQKEYPNIEVVRTGPQEVLDFIDRIEQQLGTHDNRMHDLRSSIKGDRKFKKIHSQRAEKEMFGNVENTTARKLATLLGDLPHSGYGDMAVYTLARQMRDDGTHPLFVLSDSGKQRHDLSKERNISLLNTKRMLCTLDAMGISSHAGFARGVNGVAMFNDSMQTLHAIKPDAQVKLLAPKESSKYMQETRSGKFAGTMHGLATIISFENIRKSESTQDIAGQRMRKFAQRYAGASPADGGHRTHAARLTPTDNGDKGFSGPG